MVTTHRKAFFCWVRQGMPTKPKTHGTATKAKAHKPSEDRPNAAARGYGNRWRKYRQWYLRRHPLCETCQRQGRTQQATVIHHIVPVAAAPDRQYQEENCMPLCPPCHNVIEKAKA